MEDNNQTDSTDTALQLLADQRRREVLRFLMNCEDNVGSLDDLVAAIHASGPPPSGEQMNEQRLRTVLIHKHLPKLATEDIIEYDTRSGEIRYRPHEPLEELLRFVSEELN